MPANNPLLEVRRDAQGKIWSHIRQRWFVETPEERVRQEYLCILVNEYGFALEQIAEELSVTGSGSGNARADFLIWRTAQDKLENKTALIVVECKADNVTIQQRDYEQGANYAQYVRTKFFVTHNNRETKFWKVDLAKLMPNFDEITDIPHADATDKEVEELIAKLKVFREDEFAKTLHDCHNVIRNREKLDPAAAFDEIAKILFVKVYVERKLRDDRRRENVFTVGVLERQISSDPINNLFEETKSYFSGDALFKPGEHINLRPATSKEIVRILERYNLSDTSEDIKGIAFERFLGRTFRGEIGQFFTPRSIVEFMIRMVEPKEGDIICDPASGSGGFLIRFFELVRQQILASADADYQAFKAEIEADSSLSDKDKAETLKNKYDELQETLDPKREGSRLWTLANRCIYGVDANERMARTSKMNMIMHGDGHGGVHYGDGFININGIFEGRFDIILTNPPFGANVEPTDLVHAPPLSAEDRRRYFQTYGEAYREARARTEAAEGGNKPIASLFELPKGERSKIKTEILFIERCLELLRPGGRLGVVLPEGIFNNPSLAYVREFCEDRAKLLAVVSLPQETFFSSGASVKASLLFIKKFDEDERATFDKTKAEAEAEVEAKHNPDIEAEEARLDAEIKQAKAARDSETQKALKREKADYQKRMAEQKRQEARALLKKRFAYPIFFYEAEKVGITATGEADQNELYPNSDAPSGIGQTALELHQAFRANPEAFLLGQTGA